MTRRGRPAYLVIMAAPLRIFLDPLPYPVVIVPAPTGVIYACQVGGTACLQREVEGYLVPLGGELDKATRDVLVSFQMRFRPARYDGEPDAGTAAILAALTAP